MAQKTNKGEREALLFVANCLEIPVRLGGVIASVLILVSFFLMTYAIFQRYFLNAPLKWGEEALGYLLVAIVMFGAAEASRRGDHVSIDLLPGIFSKKKQYFFSFLEKISVLGFSIVLGISATEGVIFSFNFGSFSPGYLEAPMWIPQSAMIVGSVFLGIGSLSSLIRSYANRGHI